MENRLTKTTNKINPILSIIPWITIYYIIGVARESVQAAGNTIECTTKSLTRLFLKVGCDFRVWVRQGRINGVRINDAASNYVHSARQGSIFIVKQGTPIVGDINNFVMRQ